MSYQFERSLVHTLQFEGGYANDPVDSGGETFRGVSRNNWPRWPGWVLIDRVKSRGAKTARLINAAFAGDPEMETLVADFYFQNFWLPFESLEAPKRITAKLFDMGVNVGVAGAKKILQKAINRQDGQAGLTVDGLVGPLTKAAFREVLLSKGEEACLRALAAEQAQYYQAIVVRRPGQKKFLNGWMRRAAWMPE